MSISIRVDHYTPIAGNVGKRISKSTYSATIIKKNSTTTTKISDQNNKKPSPHTTVTWNSKQNILSHQHAKSKNQSEMKNRGVKSFLLIKKQVKQLLTNNNNV